ncbi:MAG: hypothetical protein LBS88_03385 [Tannerellaceae bacterium]|nr:hypothetical protein [Tannerellaceae bacterium]
MKIDVVRCAQCNLSGSIYNKNDSETGGKSPGAFQMVADSMDFYRHCEVRSNPGCARSGLLHPPGFAMTARNDDATI